MKNKKRIWRVLFLATLVLGLMGTVSAQTGLAQDGFEDGDYAEYSLVKGSSSQVDVNTGSAYQGSYSLGLTVDGGTNAGVYRVEDNDLSPSSVQVAIYSMDVSSSTQDVSVFWLTGQDYSFGGSGTQVISVNLQNNLKVNGGNEVLSSTSANTWYFVEFKQIDWANNQVGEVYVNGNLKAQNVAFKNTASSIDTVELEVFGGSTYTGRYDELSYTVEGNNAPSIDSVSSVPSSWTVGSSVNVSASVSDGDGTVSGVSADVWEDGSLIVDDAQLSDSDGNGTWNIDNLFSVSQSDVYYNYTLTATDNDGATATYSDSQFVEDSKPEFSILKPEDKVYGNQNVYWEVNTNSTDDVLGETIDLEIQSDGTTKNTVTLTEGETASGTFTETEGNHTLKATATEQDGTTRTKETFYEIDLTPPEINITSPLGPTSSLSGLDLNYTVSDPNLDSSSCTYTKDGGTNFSINNCANTSIQFGQTGNHTIRVFAEDTVNNTGLDKLETFIDNVNEVRVKDATSGSSVQEFSVTLSNGGESLGGQTTDGQFEFNTSKMPIGSVDMTLKTDGYQTRTISFSDVDRGFTLDQEYTLKRAGLSVDAKAEETQNDLSFNMTASNTTTSYSEDQLDSFSKEFSELQNLGFPTGEVKITLQDVDGVRQPRTYIVEINENTKVNLVGYLLEKGDGIYITTEIRKPNNDRLQGALVNIQRSYGASYKTVSQAKTKSDGTASFYLSPDTSYRAVASHPSYESFTGTFSPVNYQYDPLIIQLGQSNNFTESTIWDEVEYKLEPEKKALNLTGQYSFNWTVLDSKGGLSEFGIRIKNSSGGVLKSKSVSGSPSGGSLSLEFNASKKNLSSSEELTANGYFVKDQKEFNFERNYNLIKRVEAGIYSIKTIMTEFKAGTSSNTQSFLALLFTLAIGSGLKSQFNRKGGGLVTLLILGFFTAEGWFNGFFWILTALSLIGIYGRRG